MKKSFLLTLTVVVALVITVSAAFAASLQLVWNQGFEHDVTGWNPYSGSISRVASGTGGIASSAGAWHAQAVGNPYSFFDTRRDSWPGPWRAEIDVYLDPDWAAGTGFDYSVAAWGTDNLHQRDFIFHVTSDTSTGNLLVGGSNNTNFAPREDLETVNHYVVAEAGWYTLQHLFYENAGTLAVDLNLLDAGGTVLFTETRHDAADTIPAEVGGNGYAWFTFINVAGGIAVDNHQLILAVESSKDSCKDGGWMTLLRSDGSSFKNQGDCIQYVNTNK